MHTLRDIFAAYDAISMEWAHPDEDGSSFSDPFGDSSRFAAMTGGHALRQRRDHGRNRAPFGFGHAVTHVGNESMVRVWGGCDSGQAWLLRECLDDLVATGQRRITLDVADLHFADFTAVAILVGALARIRQLGAEAAVSPQASGAYRVLKRADLTTTRAVGAR